MICPRCKTGLSVEKIKSPEGIIEIDKCNACQGIWFDYGELSRLDKVIEPTFIEIRHIPKEEEQFKNLSCPVCGDSSILQKAEHPRDKHVIIDYCRQCKGIWLDYGELEAIQKETFFRTTLQILGWLFGKT